MVDIKLVDIHYLIQRLLCHSDIWRPALNKVYQVDDLQVAADFISWVDAVLFLVNVEVVMRIGKVWHLFHPHGVFLGVWCTIGWELQPHNKIMEVLCQWCAMRGTCRLGKAFLKLYRYMTNIINDHIWSAIGGRAGVYVDARGTRKSCSLFPVNWRHSADGILYLYSEVLLISSLF